MTVNFMEKKWNARLPGNSEALAAVKRALSLGDIETFARLLREGASKGITEANYGQSHDPISLPMFIIKHHLPPEKRLEAFRSAVDSGASLDILVLEVIRKNENYYLGIANNGQFPKNYVDEKIIPQWDFFRRLGEIAKRLPEQQAREEEASAKEALELGIASKSIDKIKKALSKGDVEGFADAVEDLSATGRRIVTENNFGTKEKRMTLLEFINLLKVPPEDFVHIRTIATDNGLI